MGFAFKAPEHLSIFFALFLFKNNSCDPQVLMQTGDTELEMRGRCSAGQKVISHLNFDFSLACSLNLYANKALI